MTAKLITALFAAVALIGPVGSYAATKDAESKTEKAKEFVEDAAITTKIKGEFAKDKQVSALQIKVDTDHGKVTLTGNAKTKEEADKAVAIARATKGVAAVNNQIQVSPSAKQ